MAFLVVTVCHGDVRVGPHCELASGEVREVHRRVAVVIRVRVVRRNKAGLKGNRAAHVRRPAFGRLGRRPGDEPGRRPHVRAA